MFHSISRTIIVALIAATAVFADEPPKCSLTAGQCDLQIRQMLSGRRFLGVTIEEIPTAGLVIKAIIPNSPAERAGLKTGDRLIAVNGKSLTQASTKDFKQVLAHARENGRLWVIIWRRGAYKKMDARLEPYTKEQLDKIVASHLTQSHSATAGAQ